MKQLYKKGDLVHINADLGDTMSHFTKDVDAIVLYSYNEKYSGGVDTDVEHNYCLYIKGQGKSSWYYEHQLKLLESNRLDLLDDLNLLKTKER